ncbi:hypothetical protein GALMADRAFT_144014 [Galerina marginata CBS 339.88]|uniref:Uncharacterized protein n=1 Tax=Galerina marginata (strain CBS 339.88) TaxID=685588 RepID=A0A067SK51_GALM3|nr:hypothetical protein GALMADRAFT_144014 [Galerina marginata CBS 339.88]
MSDSEEDEILWHPKVTPYRLMVLSTTIGLGTAKAISAQKGSAQYVSTTFEWIGGTFFLILFVVNPYDSGAPSPRYLSWLFEPDCMDVIWFLLAKLSIPCPDYQSQELIPDPYSNHLPITTYRVLVCSSVTAFGIAKAAFGYLGLSTAATWTDWMLGVVATSIFYCLSLYESSSEDLCPSFFSEDRRQNVYSRVPAVSIGTLYTAGIALAVMWTISWKRFVGQAWRDSTFAYTEPDTYHPIIGKAFNMALKYFLFEMMMLCIAVGVICILLLLRLLAISLLSRAGIFYAARGRISGILLPLFSEHDPFFSPDFPSNRYIRRLKTFVHFCVHIAVHVCIFTGCLTISFLVTGVIAFVLDTLQNVDNLFFLAILTFLGMYVGVIVFVIWICDFLLLISMIMPLYFYLDDDPTQFHSSLIFS